MTDHETMPELTLTPNLNEDPAELDVLQGVRDAPVAEGGESMVSVPQGGQSIAGAPLDESMLSGAERRAVDDFAEKIDITDSNMVLQYGAAAQKNIVTFSERALGSVRTKDLGEVGEALSGLVVELKGFDGEEKKGLFGALRKKRSQIAALKSRYDTTEANVEKISKILEQHQITLMKNVAMFDKMYELNVKYAKELTMYIIAGRKKLRKIRLEQLEEMKKKAAETGTPEDAQAYNDMTAMCNRFEKKLHDLDLTRMISLQMGPQTRLLQNNDALMIEKIQSSLVNTIPLEKPDGSGAGAGTVPSGRCRTGGCGQCYQRAFAQKRGKAEIGHR